MTSHCECPIKNHGHKADHCKGNDVMLLGHVVGVGETHLCRACIVKVLQQFTARNVMEVS